MRSHAEIISAAGGYQKLADKIGLTRERVRFWERRGSIPSEAWSLVAKHKIAGLTELSAAAAARKQVAA